MDLTASFTRFFRIPPRYMYCVSGTRPEGCQILIDRPSDLRRPWQSRSLTGLGALPISALNIARKALNTISIAATFSASRRPSPVPAAADACAWPLGSRADSGFLQGTEGVAAEVRTRISLLYSVPPHHFGGYGGGC